MTSPWLRVLLVVSLALNLFILGAAGAVVLLRHGAIVRALEGDPIMHAADALPAGERDAFQAMMRAKLLSLRPGLRDAFAARRAAMEGLRAEPFDRAAASADLARGRADDAAARGAVEEALLDFAAKLPPSERATFAKGLTHAALVRWMASHPGRRPSAGRNP